VIGFCLCLRYAASVTWKPPEATVTPGLSSYAVPGAALWLAEVVPEDSCRQSLHGLMSDPFLNAVGHSGSDYSSVIPADFRIGDH